MSQRQELVDNDLIAATEAAVARWGLSEITLERVAAEAGMSRATIYRRGVTREDLIAALTGRAAETFRTQIWPALTGSGTAAERLRAALEAVCVTADSHLPTLSGMFLAHGEVFHRPGPRALSVDVFAEPFERLLRDGAMDGSLRPVDAPEVTATVLFNTVGWGYIHLRAGHEWDPETARQQILDLVLRGLLPEPSGSQP
ncbi:MULTISPECIES: TetR/AcrR family transcriptional regulator [Nocardia]|uniref:TetR/AcrR family transcriptional regulator n=1 Tax=Nocardia TaxID=1817 RepID=UPI000BF04DD4|nr:MULTISPECIES: TetR/AcrR family transcriptional regulator [Nocardia]PEH79421.1 TetR family transcriptional regulator [Nocardia sp. FDAARGOS_372]